MKPKRILILALLSGLITTVVFYLFIGQVQPGTAEQQPVMQSIVTAAIDMQENQQLTEDNLAVVEMPEAQVHGQAVKDKSELVGKFTSAPIKAGEVVMSHRIQQEEEAKVISKKVAEGFRAVSISVDFVKSVSNLIEPEDYVDITLTKTSDNTGTAPEPTELILEKVKVLAVGQRLTESKEEEPSIEYFSVTLELEPEDAVNLIDASNQGSLQLLLHSKLLSEATSEQQEMNDVGSSGIFVLPERSLIRLNPSLSASVVTVVEKGTSLKHLNEEKVDEDGRLWFQVETEEKQQGWISSRIIKFENE
ncbi:Flp pilus assembly protein CpaB [Planomicrobium sp. Y74]|uniref:Flp pilus assembly protein CpaB n=1 Tax=Planomicrobium sp. Y74 TaxID=2478977 RepID=UPI000EF4569E|nr:Flp pilus assembly protein CpaB [Planomicrobium sp. Y74]RLQ84894.1 Flp pilus assembly protein CpaB [Planomicrobium sp. Y74]